MDARLTPYHELVENVSNSTRFFAYTVSTSAIGTAAVARTSRRREQASRATTITSTTHGSWKTLRVSTSAAAAAKNAVPLTSEGRRTNQCSASALATMSAVTG